MGKQKVTWEDYKELEARVFELEDMLNRPYIYPSAIYTSLYERTTGLWAKFSRLLAYLELEDVIEPEVRKVQKKTTQPK